MPLNLRLRHAPVHVSLVGKDEQTSSRQPLQKSSASGLDFSSPHPVNATYLFLQEPVKLLSAVFDAQPVRRVDDPDQRVRLFKVVSPVRPQRLLPPESPNQSAAAQSGSNSRLDMN
ncbi:hypothetical protein BBAD15_g1886 [Beauveria bassiana D1-5]|uniref:Uncharacterized protein n=1 Tax=Beauveria bassiana D1-5 TaxID=1245745 RepID=A0A0A2VXL8_BEABA|nr:hypothetical protein BBAD15_g1886 [Beauveria bassiana D1-5]